MPKKKTEPVDPVTENQEFDAAKEGDAPIEETQPHDLAGEESPPTDEAEAQSEGAAGVPAAAEAADDAGGPADGTEGAGAGESADHDLPPETPPEEPPPEGGIGIDLQNTEFETAPEIPDEELPPDPALDPTLAMTQLPPDLRFADPDDPPAAPSPEGTPPEETPAEENPPAKPARKPARRKTAAKTDAADPDAAAPAKKPATRRKAAAKPVAAEASSPPAKPSRAAATKATEKKPAKVGPVLAVDDEVRIQTEQDKENQLWLELRTSLRSKHILTGTLGGVERLRNGACMAIVYYKGRRVVIPATEMVITIDGARSNDNKALHNRYAQILNRSLGAEVDFIVSGIDKKGDGVVGSRKAAMQRKQQFYYIPSQNRRRPLVGEGQVVEARIISVGEKNLRVEVFGVECSIMAREVSWEWVEDCNDFFSIGDRVFVKIMQVDAKDRGNIRISASIREVTANPLKENLGKCQVQGKYIGRVTGVDQHAVYLRLNVGVNAIATEVHDRKFPGKKDDVSFVITKIDKDSGIALGIITKIIRQYI